VLSIPLRGDFSRIGSAVAHWVSERPELVWQYSNVYGADGVTPLGWWRELGVADPQ
jgi:hypothetical protein